MSTSFACPLCSSLWRAGSERCVTCGADLSDPDVRAFVEAQGAALPTTSAEPAGSLGAGKVLGTTLEGLADARVLGKLALIGSGLALLAFVLPALRKFHYEPALRYGDDPRRVAEHFFSWDLWSQGNRFGLLFPLLAGVIGLAVAFAPLAARARAAILCATGLVGVFFALGRLGAYGLAPTDTGTLALAGVLIAGTAMGARVLVPTSRNARLALIVGGVVFLLGMVIPRGDLAALLPGDFALRARQLELDLSGAMPISAIAGGVDRRASELLFVALFLLAPLLLIPLATALAWRQPKGIWDKDGLALRPLTWLLLMYVPFLYALMAFSAFGWDNPLAEAALVGRLRLFVLALPCVIWAQLGLLALVLAPEEGLTVWSPLFDRLAPARRVLVAGAGGGFDIYAGLPLVLALRSQGKQVSLANLSFTHLAGCDGERLTPHLVRVDTDTRGEEGYFPERTLARWLRGQGQPDTVYAFDKVGVRPMVRGYRALVDRLQPEAIVLVDGGTDLLMRGDEAGLGTPEEDMVSLAAVASLTDVPVRLAACIGFGIDSFHGVCHAHFLENVAALSRAGGYLGAFSVPPGSPEAAGFVAAVAEAQAVTARRPSIVNGQIAAMRGEFGDVRFTRRTEGSELFVNPLMALYFAFELDALARRSLYLDRLADSETIFEVSARIEAFRREVKTRPYREIPG